MARHGGGGRILNITRNQLLKRHQAESRIEAFTAVWVERGKSIRELTMAEVLSLRAAQQEKRLTYEQPYRSFANELPGLRWEPPLADRFAYIARRPLLYQAAELLRSAL